jgi:hypothetical protein
VAVPWERRGEIGLLSALVETTQTVLTQPTLFFRNLSPTGGMGGPLLYAVIVGYVGAAAAALYNYVANALMPGGFGGFGGSPELERLRPFIEGPGVLVGTLIFGPVLVVFEVFVWSGLVHVCLLLFGGARRGFEATVRVVCFAQAANLAKLIPFCGGVLGFVYLVALLTVGLSEGHGTSRGKAFAAVVAPLVLCCCCLLGLGGMAAVMVGSAFQR